MPSISDYSKLIMKEGGHAFRSLKGAEFIPSRIVPFKIMPFGSGSFAAVFKAKVGGNLYAIRCFLNDSGDKIERYRKITNYLKPIRKGWKVGFDLLEDEIFIDRDYLPVLKMQWVPGMHLNEYVTQILNDFSALSVLQVKLLLLIKSLEYHHIGHGDLQHGNILVVEEGRNIQLKLIDYDAMFIPELKNLGGIETGMKEYQHPRRTKKDFNEKIDRFSIWVMLTAIEAVKYDKSLWQSEVHGGYNTEVNFLFQGKDFLRPNESRLFRQLLKMPQASVQYYTERLKAFCIQTVDAVDFPQLFNSTVEPPAGDISVITNPSGILVQNAAFKTLGTTPLTLDKAAYIGKPIRLVHGSTVKTIRIRESTNIIDITFLNKNAADIYGNDQKENTQKSNAKIGPLVIHKFAVSSISVTKGDPITISWNVENAKNIQLLRNGKLWHKNLHGSGSKKLMLSANKGQKTRQEVFSLVVESIDGKEQKIQKQVVTVKNKKRSGVLFIYLCCFCGCLLLAGLFLNIISNSPGRNEVATEPPPETPASEMTPLSTPTDNQQSANYPSHTVTTPIYTDAEYKQIIRDYIAAEDERDFNKIYSYYSGNMLRYWDMYVPTRDGLFKKYSATWSNATSSQNEILKIEKIRENTFKLHTKFRYEDRDYISHTIDSYVIIIFDDSGEISEVYGAKQTKIQDPNSNKVPEFPKLTQAQIDQYGNKR